MTRISFLLSLILCCLLSHIDRLAASETKEDVASMLHAQAKLFELDKKVDEALVTLRKAQQTDPSNREIACELARLSYETRLEHTVGQLTQDAEIFLQVPSDASDVALLKSYILALLGHHELAQIEVKKALQLNPKQTEATELSANFSKANLDFVTALPWSLQLRSGLEFDSNVMVSPDTTASNLKGTRNTIQSDLSLRPLDRTDVRVDTQVTLDLNRHLNNRSELAGLDYEALGAQVHLRKVLSLADVVFLLSGAEMFLDNFSEHYGRDITASAQFLTHTQSAWGLQGTFGVQEFFDRSQENENSDRDGNVWSMAGIAAYEYKNVSVLARFGYLSHVLDGNEQRFHGYETAFEALWAGDRIKIALGVDYSRHLYSDHPQQRKDHLLQFFSQADWQFKDPLSLFLDYAFYRNFSQENFSYKRHLVQTGISLSWN